MKNGQARMQGEKALGDFLLLAHGYRWTIQLGKNLAIHDSLLHMPAQRFAQSGWQAPYLEFVGFKKNIFSIVRSEFYSQKRCRDRVRS